MAALMFYQEPTALDKKKHIDLKLNRTSDYSFASGVNSVPLGGVEFFHASRDFPILFIKNEKGEYLPMAILSLKSDSHDLGDDWKEAYIPAFIRRYPFAMTSERVIMFDAKAPHFESDEGEALFEGEDKPTETLKQIVGFLEQIDLGFRRTEDFSKALGEKELFEPYNATVKFKNGEVKMNDLFCINEKKLHEALDKDELQEWFNKGWIAWCHAHLHSLSSMPEIIKRQRKTIEEPGQPEEAPAEETKAEETKA